ncbi:uncharacterized protein LOC127122636 [Lathyrus oleraceus]|uniref:uncharacterized protein LOC127122636 n=1 Tax=Pisum sativum TaxID=3888 RepID=UPI0021D35754|nr:uncharacterized protein LOC127122636 [Pisum sativum]
MAVKIKEGVQKQFDVGFLVTDEYPLWVANIVPVPKKDGKLLDFIVSQKEDYQKDFDNIKEYLLDPPILSPLVEEIPLIMYLTVLEESMGCVLGQQDETSKREHAIYYLSNKFTDYESRYSMIEKTCRGLA